MTKNFIRIPRKMMNHNDKQGQKISKDLFGELNTTALKIKFDLIRNAKIHQAARKRSLDINVRTKKNIFSYEVDGISSNKSTIKSLKISKKELCRIAKEDLKGDKHINVIEVNDDRIVYELTNAYLNMFNAEDRLYKNQADNGKKVQKGVYIDVKPLMSYRTINQIKLHILVSFYSIFRMPLYTAIRFLGLNTAKSVRKFNISNIKRLFRSLNNVHHAHYEFREGHNFRYYFVITRKNTYSFFKSLKEKASKTISKAVQLGKGTVQPSKVKELNELDWSLPVLDDEPEQPNKGWTVHDIDDYWENQDPDEI
ncbi:conserved hypothetical protein [Vibrio aestuarianus]|jgi:uncharacterized membrane protein YkoI|nr:conserved hypothetical protein [Vibrio aestuarianus]